ncbi:MAG: galactokinase [Anaerolineales bacterium]|jgi:galactokinase|nr:galactokinase [Anaerolineales bacterium]
MIAASLYQTFQQAFQHPPALLARAPGRVNLLGEHVDYNEGLVLPAAIDRAVYLHASPAADDCLELSAIDLNARVSLRLCDLERKIDRHGDPLPAWALYPAGVAWSLRQAGLEVGGMQAAFTSEVPIGAGLSSSAAIEVAFAVAWQALGGWQVDPIELARLCQRTENAYVGVSSGLMDQFASICGVEDHALYFDTRSLEWQPAPIPEGLSLIIADSGQRRSLADSKYNDRRRACEQAVEALRRFLPDIHSLRDVSATEFAAYSPYLDEIPRKRAEHVVKEIQRVRTALNAMLRGDRQSLGALMYAGHNSLRTLYEVSTPELDTLVELTRGLPGCVGARMTGAGFGGCTINLVETAQADAFIAGLKAGYLAAAGSQAAVYLCRASRGASVE